MKKALLGSVAAALLAVGLAGCSDNASSGADASASAGTPADAASASAPASAASESPAASASQVSASGDIHLEIDKTDYTLVQWKMDGSHTADANGKLLIGDQPVAGAVIHVGDNQHDIVTGKDGSFQLLVDQSLLSEVPVHVVSLDGATVGGRPIGADVEQQLLAASTWISVYYPIKTMKVEPSAKDPSLVQVYGQVVNRPGDVISFFQIDKYRIGGIVKDANGDPLKNAVVWIDRDEGEGFAKSTPTDANGRYYMYYMPEDDEGTNLTVTTEDGKRYTLPKGRVYYIPDETSVDIDITLPKEGTEIVDKPPTLVSVTSPGAMYTGVLVGLNVPADVAYSVTIPDKQGNFVLTVPKSVWEQNPTFFETKMTKFVEDRELTWGDTLPSSFIQPAATEPKGIKAEEQGV